MAKISSYASATPVDADKILGSNSYDEAKVKYNEALGLKSEEQYPKDKLKEIKGILAEIAKKEAEEKAKEAKYGPSSKLRFETGNGNASVRASTVSGEIEVSH